MSEAKKPVGCENNPMYGKNHTEETRTKISDALTGKNLSEETRTKISPSPHLGG